jgi:hypothetical protein
MRSSLIKTTTLFLLASAGSIMIKHLTTAELDNEIPNYVLKTLTFMGLREPKESTYTKAFTDDTIPFTIIATAKDDLLSALSVLPHGETIKCGFEIIKHYLHLKKQEEQQEKENEIDTPRDICTDEPGKEEKPTREFIMDNLDKLLNIREDAPRF